MQWLLDITSNPTAARRKSAMPKSWVYHKRRGTRPPISPGCRTPPPSIRRHYGHQRIRHYEGFAIIRAGLVTGRQNLKYKHINKKDTSVKTITEQSTRELFESPRHTIHLGTRVSTRTLRSSADQSQDSRNSKNCSPQSHVGTTSLID